MIVRATKKPVEVQAFHYTDPIQIKEISEWLGIGLPKLNRDGSFRILSNDSPSWITFDVGDWIIKEPKGKVSTLPDSTFNSLYDYKLWEAE